MRIPQPGKKSDLPAPRKTGSSEPDEPSSPPDKPPFTLPKLNSPKTLAVLTLILLGIGVYWWTRPPALPPPIPEDWAQLDNQLGAYLAKKVQWVQEDPSEAERHATLGLVYFANSLWPEAQQAFRNAIRLDDGDPLPMLYLAIATQQAGDRSLAMNLLQRVTEHFPGFAPAYFHLSDAYLRAGEHAKAEAAFQRLIELEPQEWRAYAGLAQAKLNKNQFDEAREFAEKALKLEPQARFTHHLLGLAYRGLGRIKDAEREMRLGQNANLTPPVNPWSNRLPQHMKLLPDQLEMALTYADKGRVNKALAILQEALAWHPDNVRLLKNAGDILNQAGNPKKAHELLLRALEIDPEYLPAYYTLTDSCLNLGKNEDAMQYAEKAIELAPNQGRPYLAKARVLLAQEENEAAYAAMKTALQYDPKNPFILMDLGDVSLRLLDRPGEALEFYLQANELEPTLVPVYLRLADVYVRLENPEPARRALDQARTLEPGNQMIPLIEERLVELETSNAAE